jgi:hypothetical protein
MSQYRPRDERRIDAMQFTGGEDNADEIKAWSGDNHVVSYYPDPPDDAPEHLGVLCRVGDIYSLITVELGQWLVKGSNETIYEIDPNTFDWLYEAVAVPADSHSRRE